MLTILQCKPQNDCISNRRTLLTKEKPYQLQINLAVKEISYVLYTIYSIPSLSY